MFSDTQRIVAVFKLLPRIFLKFLLISRVTAKKFFTKTRCKVAKNGEMLLECNDLSCYTILRSCLDI